MKYRVEVVRTADLRPWDLHSPEPRDDYSPQQVQAIRLVLQAGQRSGRLGRDYVRACRYAELLGVRFLRAVRPLRLVQGGRE